MRILLVSPYDSGSHRSWAEGYRDHSVHDVQMLCLPGRFWKWRMHGGAITLARRFLRQGYRPDVLLCTDMLDLTTFLALTRPITSTIPVILFMHENQLTYPLQGEAETLEMRFSTSERDRHYAFVNFSSMLAADAIWFNSAFHRTAFFQALPGYLSQFPDFRELGSLDRLKQKSLNLPVGVEMPVRAGGTGSTLRDRPLILWNQRWEFDKNPQLFLDILCDACQTGLEFEVALCGESFQQKPAPFESAIERLKERIIHSGHADRKTYRDLLRTAEVVISTAHHEFFGISILEAIGYQSFPLLPERLSYPELIPESFHGRCLYRSPDELRAHLEWALTNRGEAQALAGNLSEAVRCYSWQEVAPRYDHQMMELAARPAKPK